MNTGYKKLFVHNLEFRVNHDQIHELFRPYGPVQTIDIPRTPDGRHKGLCFIEFEQHEAAKRAKEAVNETMYHGRKL